MRKQFWSEENLSMTNIYSLAGNETRCNYKLSVN